MAGTPQDKARPEPGQGPDDDAEVLAGDPTGKRVMTGADQATLVPRLNDVPQDVPVADVDAVARWAGQAPVADLEDAASLPPPPEVLVARGRTRYARLLLLLSAGLALILPTALDYGSVDDFASFLSYTAHIGAVALIFGSIALRGFLRGIRADQNGVTVVSFLHRVPIPWHQLRGIGFHQDDPDAWYYELEFTLAGRSVIAPVPGGGKKPGQYLSDLRETLLAMQAANAFRFDGRRPMRLRVPNRVRGARRRVRYSEGDMRLRVTYPAQSTETPSALFIRSEHDPIFVILLLASGFFALMAWAANGPPPDGDVVSARMMAVLALGLVGTAWRYASGGRLRATEPGIVLTGFASRRRIPWAAFSTSPSTQWQTPRRPNVATSSSSSRQGKAGLHEPETLWLSRWTR